MTTVAQSTLAFPSDRLTAPGDAFATVDANAHVAHAAAPWLPSASTSREALDDPRGWYQQALAAEASVRSRVNVMHLATANLSFDERHEAQAFTRHTLARGDERVRPFVLPADSYSWSTPMWSALVKDRQHVVSHAWRRRGFARAALESATAFIGIQLWAPFALAICPKVDSAFWPNGAIDLLGAPW
jgi:hypothetical protein